MTKLLLYFIISAISNVGLITGLCVIFQKNIKIHFHLEESVLVVALVIFIISMLLISRLLAEVLGEKTMQWFLRIGVSTLIANLGINITYLIIKTRYLYVNFLQ